jgi:acetyl/propionyl-CoA carboxylase alpha subunit
VREAARAALSQALADTVIGGVGTNLPFLRAIVGHERFAAARLDTGFLATAYPGGWRPPAPDRSALALAAAITWLSPHAFPSPWSTLAGWRVTARSGESYVHVRSPGGEDTVCRISGDREHIRIAIGDDDVSSLAQIALTDETVSYVADGARHTVPYWRRGETITIGDLPLTVRPPEHVLLARRDAAATQHRKAVVAPMPGLVTEIRVKPGDTVKQGDIAVLFEAMKMVQSLAVPADGVVSAVHCTEGAFAQGQAVLIEFQE